LEIERDVFGSGKNKIARTQERKSSEKQRTGEKDSKIQKNRAVLLIGFIEKDSETLYEQKGLYEAVRNKNARLRAVR
jgi:hypothetical protein